LAWKQEPGTLRQTLQLGLLLGATAVALAGHAPASPAAWPRPNLILLSVDTLRADHLGRYGYSRPTSPHLDQLLRRGAWFSDATCNVPLTNPSFSSMLTSRYAHQTGATRNGIPMLPGNPTLAQLLKDQGYHTAAILSNWPLKAHLSGLQPGFDFYDDEFFEKRWLFFNDERDAESVTAHALAWLEQPPAEPFFLWVHYSDPHAPYLNHPDFSFRSRARLSPAERNLDDYDSEIAYTDHYIGKLLEALQAQEFFPRTLIVFVADHGESLGEHQYTGHGRNLYQPSLRVPFGLVGPGIPQDRRLDAPVELLDLAPTLLAYAGLPPGPKMLGRNLLPVIQGRAELPRQLIYFETYPGAVPQVKGAEEVMNLRKPIWIGFRDGPVKISYSLRTSRWELYHLGPDPGELHNLAKATDPHFIEVSERLLAWYNLQEKEGLSVGQTDALTDQDRKQFESLGYVDK
jgi:arylsulfatase A-like enzyme